MLQHLPARVVEKDTNQAEEEEEQLSEDENESAQILRHEDAIVKIFSMTQSPDYDCPWQSLSIDTTTGSGVIISAGRILTGKFVSLFV